MRQELIDYLEMKVKALKSVDSKGFIDDYSFTLGKLEAYSELMKELLEIG